ncbi:hypothetical protein, partial [Phenylobacterium sp.]|uniref:hypothetical protein n=1 Tax=Phenylobacterium sp. TaxID=1871053 RepID=UPI00286D6A25
TPGGLSGGPVFNENGRVVGILSKSLGDAESGRPSYVSLIWPALIAEVDATWPPNWPDGRASVKMGVKLGWVKATDLHYSTHDGKLSLVLPKPVGPAV